MRYTIQRTRKTPQEPESMVVNKEGDQQKRTKKEPASASVKKKRKTKEELLKIKAEEREAKRDEKLEAKIVKEVKKFFSILQLILFGTLCRKGYFSFLNIIG